MVLQTIKRYLPESQFFILSTNSTHFDIFYANYLNYYSKVEVDTRPAFHLIPSYNGSWYIYQQQTNRVEAENYSMHFISLSDRRKAGKSFLSSLGSAAC